jgi:hypothetical protein
LVSVQYLPVAHISLVRASLWVAVMMLVYGDESMDETQQRVCAVAIVAGREQDWQQLEQKWIARTGEIPFHANDCDSDRADSVSCGCDC